MMLRPNDVFASRFEIDRIAGAGGMGTVYRARDRLSGQSVALKLLHGPGEDRDAERFAREAQVLADVRHPGIVAHVAHGQASTGHRFLAMEWLDGENLAQRLARGPLRLDEALRLVRRVADALAFAHQRGVIHRDLKPNNLFLPDGDVDRVKILDFGIARRVGMTRGMTRTGVVLGTPEYIAPEQARGGRDITPAADIFSLGCVLYECLAGEPPFAADHIAAVLVRILFEEPMAIERRRPGLPETVRSLLARMLDKDPARRVGDAAAVVAAITAIGEVPELPTAATMVGRTTPPPRHTPSEEQSLFSLVVALPHEDPDPEGTTMPMEAITDVQEHTTLLSIVRALGARADVLAGSALVVSVPALGSATDQVVVAARCALAIIEKWPGARVAIVTGRGSVSGTGLITGDVIDRAWRLLRSGTPAPAEAPQQREDAVRVDEVSAGLLSGRFELVPSADAGFILGGERLGDDPSRPLLGRPTLCVGRDSELGILEATLAECRDESVARAVLVLAPPGIGKSRLRHEFLRRVEERGEPTLLLLGRGEPVKAQTPYALLGEALRRCGGIAQGAGRAEQQAALRRWVTATVAPQHVERVTEFLGELCAVPRADSESPQLRAAREDPRVMADHVEWAWLTMLRALAEQQPVVLVVEDLHWSDVLTVKLVGAALRALAESPLLVLALARPEVSELYPNLWAGAVQSLPLHPLSKKASERLVKQVLGAQAGPETISRMVEQAAGNPLFLEELIRAGASRKASGELPGTVMAMLQARIAKLAPELRRTLRAASVFGEVFWDNGVRRLLASTHESYTGEGVFSELVREELIEVRQERQFAGESEYRFRHALLREALYDLLGEQEAATWHLAAGEFLESVGERDAAVLAEHFRRGRDLARAANYYLQAAEQAHDAWDTQTALACVQRGLDCGAEGEVRGGLLSLRIANGFWIGRLDEPIAWAEEAVSLLPAGSLRWCRVFESALLAAVILQQHALLGSLLQKILAVEPEPDARTSYIRSTASVSIMMYVAAQKDLAEVLHRRAAQVGELLGEGDEDARGVLHAMEANRVNQREALPQSFLRELEQSTACCARAGDRRFQVAVGTYIGQAYLALGQPEAALKALREFEQIAEQIEDEGPLSYVRTYLARHLALCGSDDALAEAHRLATAVAATPNVTLVGLAHGVLAEVARRRGDLDVAEAEAQAACTILQPFLPYRLDLAALWAEILVARGKDDAARQVLEETAQQIEALALEPYGLLDLYVALSEARQRGGDEAGARAVVARALAVLRRRVADVTDPDLRASYLGKVATNVRLLELAAAHGLAPDLPG